MHDNLTIMNATSPLPETLHYQHCDYTIAVTFQYYTWGIVGSIVSCCGIVGNILSIKVLSHRNMRNSASYFLISLSVYDIIVLLSMLMFLALPTIYLEKDEMESYYFAYMYLHPFVYPVALIAQTGTIYTTLALAVERYIAVCKPFHVSNMCSMSRTKTMIITIFISSVAYNIPRFFEFKTTQKWSDTYNRTIPIISKTEIGQNSVFREVYFIYSYLVIMFLVPFGVLTALSSFLIRAVKKARALRSLISTSHAKETNLTIILIVVIDVSLGCHFPALVDNIVAVILDKETLHCSVEWVRFTTISSLLVAFSSAINFVLYCLLCERFRRVLLQILCMKTAKPKFKYTVQQKTMNLRLGHYRSRRPEYERSVPELTTTLL